jgi:hypothetical protein
MDPIKPSQVIIAEDCFQLSNIPNDRLGQVLVKSVEKIYGGQLICNYDTITTVQA